MAHSSLVMSTSVDSSNQECEYYCLFHDIFCSFGCVMETHRFCQVMSKDDVTEDALSSGMSTRKAAEKVETKLKDLTQEFLAIEKFLADVNSSIDDKQKKCLKDIVQVRNRINTHLDSLEKKVRDRISHEHKNLISKLENTKKQIWKNKNAVQDIANKLDNVKQDGTDRQLLFAIKSSEKSSQHIRQYLDKLRKTYELMEKNIYVQVDSTLNEFDKNIHLFGRVVGESTQSIMSFSKPVTIEFCQRTPRTEIRAYRMKENIFKCPKKIDITGCALLSDRTYVLAESLKNQLLILESGIIKGTVTFAHPPFDVCRVRDNTVAVTIPNDHSVVYVDIVLMKIIKSVNFENKCYYVDCDDKRLAIGFPGMDKIIITDLEGKNINCFKIRGTRFTLRHNYIYSVNERDDEVLCYDLSGNEVWTYPDQIMKPAGVAVDKMQYVYVFSKFNNSVYAISPSRYNSTIVIDRDDVSFNDFRCFRLRFHRLFVFSRNQGVVYETNYYRPY